MLYGEGTVLWLTNDGESVLWKGFGVGRPTGPPPAGHYAVCGLAQTESQRFVRLTAWPLLPNTTWTRSRQLPLDTVGVEIAKTGEL